MNKQNELIEKRDSAVRRAVVAVILIAIVLSVFLAIVITAMQPAA